MRSRPRAGRAVTPQSVIAAARPVTTDLSPREVLHRLPVSDGLVVLSGEWAGGGLVIAQRPIRTVIGARLPEAFSHQPTDDSGKPDVLGGGWFGWLGYPQPRPEHWFGLYPNVLRYRREQGAWFDEAVAGLVPERELEQRRQQALRPLRPGPAARGEYRLAPLRPDQGAGRYTGAVEACINRIRAGDLYQANVSLRLHSEFAGDAVALFAELTEALTPAYAALVCGPNFTVVSMSPELFLRRQGCLIKSAPIKGTRPRSAGTTDQQQVAELRSSPKERAENIMIVDLVRNDLARVAEVGSVTVPALLQVEPRCGVWHLISTVAARLRPDLADADLLAASFPPGSVTGAPKLAAQQVIEELEATPRGLFTGAIGYLSPSAGLELSVAIRTLELTGPPGGPARVELGVGAGITAGSTPIDEWYECIDKAAPLAAAMSTTIEYEPRPRPRLASGIFETMLVLDGRIVALGEHLDRLATSAAALWAEPLPAGLADTLRNSAARLSTPAARLRIDLGARTAPTIRSSPAAVPVPVAEQPGLRLPTARVEHGAGDHKWADRAAIDRLEAQHGGQVLFLDADGYCLETTRANLLVFTGPTVLTPPLDGRILPGVTRRRLLDLAAQLGLPVEIRPVHSDELVGADGVATCGSVAGLCWVGWTPTQRWGAPTETMRELSAALLASWT